MESAGEPISVRVARLNSEITGKIIKTDANCIVNREGLLDTLQALYDECSIENLQKQDKNIEYFFKTYKTTMENLRKTRINLTDFEIKNCIGRGHFGDVHVVIEKNTRDIYAMKSIRKCDSLDQKKTSFTEERNIMALTQSPWLTSLQYAFQDITHLFFVMEFHPGGDLLGLLYKQGGTLPESAATFYLAEIILGLQDLHKMGYVHRDIKPDNILLDRCGHLKLADFGSAAKLDSSGFAIEGPPVGTPDYVAPEILEAMENKQGRITKYGVSCDFWSVGILAYELTIGTTPFSGQNTSTVYTKIMNHNSNLKFPPDVVLSQAYVTFIKSLVVDQKSRLSLEGILNHSLFKNVHFDTLREQVPPFVPKISSFDDTSNFSDVPARKKAPCIENFKKRMQFSGRNLPFVGFTYTPDCEGIESSFDRRKVKDEMVENLKSEMEKLRKKLAKNDGTGKEKENLEKKLEEKTRKLENVESVRNQLEKDIANNIAECTALKRTLEFERRDRAELEKKALDLIKSAKLKWENEEKRKVDSLNFTIDEQREKIRQLSETNKMLEEQVQHALKIQAKHKVSMETVEKLSRRSVIGLESRLDKVTSETQNTISDLQGRLNEQFYQKTILERQISKLKEKESTLSIKLKNSEDNYKNLNNQVDEAEVLIRDLEKKVTLLEKESELLDSYKGENQYLKEKINDDKKMIKDLENRCTHLEIENKNIAKLRLEIEELKRKSANMEKELKKIEALEVELQKAKEKANTLNKQIQETENNTSESQELKEMRTKYWRMEKELNNFKIDKRILERELKESSTKNKQLVEETEKLNGKIMEDKKNHESALLEMNSINESISMELIKVRETERNLQDKLNAEKKINEELKHNLAELKALCSGKDEKMRCLSSELDLLRNKFEAIQKEKERMGGSVDILNREKVEMKNELEKTRRENQNLQLNLEALREACSLLESQVVEYQRINESFKEKGKVLNSNTEKLIKDLCDAKKEIQEAKQLANEEKSYKLIAETKIQRLKEEMKSLESENDSYKQQAMEYRQYSNQLTEELTAAEEKITDLEVAARSFERQIEDFVFEDKQLKEELSEYITQLHKCREINYKLTHQVNELKEEKKLLIHKINDLDAILQEKASYYKEREVKSESTIKQQIKLIDYLQTKIDENQSKKKTFTLFGNSKKENTAPLSLPLNYKDIEFQLQKERASNRLLQEEIYRLKAENSQKINEDCAKEMTKVNRHRSEIVSPKTKIAMQKLVQSPSSQIKDISRKNSVQRMHHNIPHRFESKLCTKPLKCAQCRNNVIIGRYMSVCKECNVRVHSNCSSSVPSTCGLPRDLVKHYKNSLNNSPSTEEDSTQNEDCSNVASFIKIPGQNNGWEKRYAILSETHLNIYTESPKNTTSKLVQSFELAPEDSRGKVVLEPLLSEVDIPVAKSDLPFLMKVEIAPNTTCWPPKCLIFLTLSVQDKDMWYKALQKLFQEENEKLYCETIMQITEGVTVNCIIDLTEGIKAVGTQKGLYCYYNDSLLPIDGFTEVHHIAIVKPANSLVMIVNAKNIVVTCGLHHLINITQCTAAFAKPNLKYDVVNIKGLNGFHLLESCKKGKHKMFCVATPKQLVIVGYDENEEEFVPLRFLDTAEPTGTVLFTEHSIIVGADKFFEIDIATFKAEEFLDSSNPKLKQVLKCHQMKSYPLSAMEIGDNPREYLVAFNEFSIFVDEYGSPSRKREWIASHLPLAIFYIKPYLYIIEFSAVEIHRITENTCEDEEENTSDFVRIHLDKFQNVGVTKRGIYILHKNSIKLVEGRKILPSDDSSVAETETTDNDSDRFSFTSSMVQSLDGHLDEENSGKTSEKCVTFAQTSL